MYCIPKYETYFFHMKFSSCRYHFVVFARQRNHFFAMMLFLLGFWLVRLDMTEDINCMSFHTGQGKNILHYCTC